MSADAYRETDIKADELMRLISKAAGVPEEQIGLIGIAIQLPDGCAIISGCGHTPCAIVIMSTAITEHTARIATGEHYSSPN